MPPKTAPRGIASSMPHPHHAKKVNPPKLHAAIKAALSINLMAETPTDTVHGHISTIRKAAGVNFGSSGDICPMCDGTFPAALAHECCEIVLYEAGEAPNDEHESTIAPHGLNADQKAQLFALVQAHTG